MTRDEFQTVVNQSGTSWPRTYWLVTWVDSTDPTLMYTYKAQNNKLKYDFFGKGTSGYRLHKGLAFPADLTIRPDINSVTKITRSKYKMLKKLYAVEV